MMGRLAALLLGVVLLSGCATMQDSPVALRIALEYGTLKVIDGDAERAERVVELMDGLIALTEGDAEATVALLDRQLRDQIDWDALEPAETVLVLAVLAEVRRELERQIGDGLLDPDDRVQVVEALNWIRGAALL